MPAWVYFTHRVLTTHCILGRQWSWSFRTSRNYAYICTMQGEPDYILQDDDGAYFDATRVRVDGGTNLTQRGVGNLVPGFKGYYTRSQSAAPWWRAARIHKGVALRCKQQVYLITLTWPADVPDESRHGEFRRFIDRLRKVPNVAGYIWTRERHQSNLAHYHVLVRCWRYWNYVADVQRWSNRYCKSVQGMDVQRVNAKATAYLAKTYGYLRKGCPDELAVRSPNRWWGTSRIVRWSAPHARRITWRKGCEQRLLLLERGIVKVDGVHIRHVGKRAWADSGNYERAFVDKQIELERKRWRRLVALNKPGIQ